jgi:hypothetical protein
VLTFLIPATTVFVICGSSVKTRSGPASTPILHARIDASRTGGHVKVRGDSARTSILTQSWADEWFSGLLSGSTAV